MNRNQSDYDQYRQYGSDSGYHTRRSEKYRHPEQHRSNFPQHQDRFDDYGSSARGGYGNEGHLGTYGNQGNEMGGSRNESNQDIYGTYSTSRNYGNMGSYGGAQGYGTSRGGYGSQRRYDDDRNSSFDSGMSSFNRQGDMNRGYRGYQSDQDYSRNQDFESQSQGWEGNRGWHNDSDDRDSRWGSNRSSDQDQYGSDTSRRFQGSRQGSYDFDRTSNRPYQSDRDSNRSNGYYMGSSYNRVARGDYSSGDGNYGSLRRSNEEQQDKPYGLSGYYSGGYGPQDL